MKSARFELPSADRDHVRTIVASIDCEMARLSGAPAKNGSGTGATVGLSLAWAELVKVLALGRAPEVRECPVCKQVGMRAATRCGCCWTKLSPLAPVGPGEDPTEE